jgi:4-alpha-glucanotransferase
MVLVDVCYVASRQDLFATGQLTSQRHQCAVVGEDLGTVPDHVRPAMRRHGIARLFVGQFAMPGRVGEPLGEPSGEQVASLNTHDTATFAGFWRGTDIDDRLDLRLITSLQADEERLGRAETRRAILATSDDAGIDDISDQACATAMAHCTRDLAASAAHVVLVTGEDLWLELSPQNVPGTSDERPNWQRPWSRTVEQLENDAGALAVLDDVARCRSGR